MVSVLVIQPISSGNDGRDEQGCALDAIQIERDQFLDSFKASLVVLMTLFAYKSHPSMSCFEIVSMLI